MIKIIVPSEEVKQDLIEQSRYCSEFEKGELVENKHGKIFRRPVSLNWYSGGILIRLHVVDDVIEVDTSSSNLKVFVNSAGFKSSILENSEYIHNFKKQFRTTGEDKKVKIGLAELEIEKCKTLANIYKTPNVIVVDQVKSGYKR